MHRRDLLELLGAGFCLPLSFALDAQVPPSGRPADVTLHISPVEVEIAPGKKIQTTGYNGSAPGPFLRFREGQRVIVDVFNDTKEPELVHWHGFFLPPEIDGAAEEGTPFIQPHTSQRYTFLPRPAGTRWYHSHVYAGRNLKRSTYTGQFGMVYVEPQSEPGAYDAEHLLCLHAWDPYLSSMGGEGSLEAAYEHFSVNDRALGYGEPIRVREGQQVLFRILNASATMIHRIALAGHELTVVSLDGNPVAAPRAVKSLTLGAAERADVMVTMNSPGVWVLGEVDDQVRTKGLGVVVEYENQSGSPQWTAPGDAPWDYTVFGTSRITPEPDEVVPMVFRRKFAGNNWVDHWTINGKEFPKTDPILLRANKKYRLRFDNQSDDDHPVHLHRHSFELTRFAGKNTAGVVKDVVVVPRRAQVEVDFVADDPGLTLFHCHNQLHMDFGFMTLFRYVDS
jgi:FtsP/CotA-like multicopper oxidase with cupredoxin domain